MIQIIILNKLLLAITLKSMVPSPSLSKIRNSWSRKTSPFSPYRWLHLVSKAIKDMFTFILYKPQAATNYARTNFFKGVVQRILRGADSRIERSLFLNYRPQYFLMNFKGPPPKEKHKTVFSGWSKICLVKITLRRSFQQSAILSVTLTLVFRSLPTWKVHFLKLDDVKSSNRAKATVNTIYS